MAERLASLQAGRGVAALLVVLFHAGEVFAPPRFAGSVDGGLFRFGRQGVAFFFVLSGFIILHAHRADLGHAECLPRYLTARARRIYLPYWAVLAPLILAYCAIPSLGGAAVTAPAVMANSPLLVGATNQSTLAVAWTLFHEIAFYALFAVAIVSARIGIALLAAWQGACLAVLLTGVPAHYALQPVNLLFGMGMVACIVSLPARAGMPVLVAGVLAFVAAGLASDYGAGPPHAWAALVFGAASTAIVMGAVAAERARRLRVPRALGALGDASYALYLVHFPVLSAVAKLLTGAPVGFAYAVGVSGSIAAGVAFYRFVERPLLRLGKGQRVVTRRKTAS